MKDLESLEIAISETFRQGRRFSFQPKIKDGRVYPFGGDLPLNDRSSWRVILKANGGYGKNHETGMTAIIHWKGELRDVFREISMALVGYFEEAEKHGDES